jgi:hypothetical protein
MWQVRLRILATRPRVDDQVVAEQAVVRLGVRDGGAQHLLHLPGGGARREGEDGPRLGHGAAADVLRDEPCLAGGRPHPLRLGAHLACLRGRH